MQQAAVFALSSAISRDIDRMLPMLHCMTLDSRVVGHRFCQVPPNYWLAHWPPATDRCPRIQPHSGLLAQTPADHRMVSPPENDLLVFLFIPLTLKPHCDTSYPTLKCPAFERFSVVSLPLACPCSLQHRPLFLFALSLVSRGRVHNIPLTGCSLAISCTRLLEGSTRKPRHRC
ncbi:hypothetical protein L209DRAFT_246473 [Thermothelomyces heterothallicus CBS 203.75]